MKLDTIQTNMGKILETTTRTTADDKTDMNFSKDTNKLCRQADSKESTNILIRKSSNTLEELSSSLWCCPGINNKIIFLVLSIAISVLGIWLLCDTLSEKGMIRVAEAFIRDDAHKQDCSDKINALNELLSINYSMFSLFSYIVTGLGVLLVTFAFIANLLMSSLMSTNEDRSILLPVIMIFKSYILLQVVAIICISKDRGGVFEIYNLMEDCKILQSSSSKGNLQLGEETGNERTDMSLFLIDNINLTEMEQGLVWGAGSAFAFAILLSLIHIIILLLKMCKKRAKNEIRILVVVKE